MADTYVQKIISAISTLMAAAGKPANLVVSTSRVKPASASKLIVVAPLLDAPAREATSRNREYLGVRRLLTVGLLCRVSGMDSDNEALRKWVISQLFKDQTLGGLASSISEGETEWQGEMDSESDYSIAVMQIVVEYARPKNSLEYVAQ
jgi:hypothetical protein